MTAAYEWLADASVTIGKEHRLTAGYEWLADASLWWWPRFADHLWQTTLFALVVLLASFALRRGPARSRHNFWLLASGRFALHQERFGRTATS